MNLSKKEQKICKACNECCHWMSFTCSFHKDKIDEYKEFYVARGCRIKNEEDVLNTYVKITIMVRTTCPLLGDFGCRDYDGRPELCKGYDCREDPLMDGLSDLTK